MARSYEISTRLQRILSVALGITLEYENFMSLSHQYTQGYCRSMVGPEDVVRAQMLLELLFIRSGAFCLDSLSVSDVKVLIGSLCTCYY